MRINLYALRDKAAEEFGPIYMAKNDLIANRIAKNQLAGNLAKSDFSLAYLGQFDTDTGLIDDNVVRLFEVNYAE